MRSNAFVWRLARLEHLDFRFGQNSFRLMLPEGVSPKQKTHFLANFPAWALVGPDLASPPPTEVPYKAAPSEPWLSNFLGGLQFALGDAGFAPFHGALVEMGKKLTIVCGESGAGKSFFSLCLAQKGRLLSDDLFFGRVTADTLEVVPLPRFAKSRSMHFKGVHCAPTPQEGTSFSLDDVILIFPRIAPDAEVAFLSQRGDVFSRLLKGNLYGDAAQSLRNAKLQLDLRKRLSASCRAFDVAYRLVDDPTAIRDLVSNLAL